MRHPSTAIGACLRDEVAKPLVLVKEEEGECWRLAERGHTSSACCHRGGRASILFSPPMLLLLPSALCRAFWNELSLNTNRHFGEEKCGWRLKRRWNVKMGEAKKSFPVLFFFEFVRSPFPRSGKASDRILKREPGPPPVQESDGKDGVDLRMVME